MTEQQARASIIEAVKRFNEAFNRRDVDAIMAAMTQDCVFENTSPPDGRRYTGQAAVRSAWEDFFNSTPGTEFEAEEMFTCGDRSVVRWTFHWTGQNGEKGRIRGVDIFRVRDGKVAEKLSYVKG
jgi:ketosteroid isomerase-like protein